MNTYQTQEQAQLPYEKKILVIKKMLEPVSLLSHWNEIRDTYTRFGFSDNMSDAEKIEEYSWVNSMYKKYISTQKKEVLLNIDEPKILKNMIESWYYIKPSSSVDITRRYLVYLSLRRNWLVVLAQKVDDLIDDE